MIFSVYVLRPMHTFKGTQFCAWTQKFTNQQTCKRYKMVNVNPPLPSFCSIFSSWFKTMAVGWTSGRRSVTMWLSCVWSYLHWSCLALHTDLQHGVWPGLPSNSAKISTTSSSNSMCKHGSYWPVCKRPKHHGVTVLLKLHKWYYTLTFTLNAHVLKGYIYGN